MKLYKLTDEKDQTYNNTQWGENVTHEATGEGKLCTEGWIHAYTDPLLAVLLNPIHASFFAPHLWEAEGEIGKEDHGLKVGCKRLTTIRRIELPQISYEQKGKFGILCAKKVYKNPAWNLWADDWLSRKDRSADAAYAAADDAADAAYAARTAALAALAVAYAARAAALAVAYAARAAARAAALAADGVNASYSDFDLIKLAHEAIL